jgi:hypothetical protein
MEYIRVNNQSYCEREVGGFAIEIFSQNPNISQNTLWETPV